MPLLTEEHKVDSFEKKQSEKVFGISKGIMLAILNSLVQVALGVIVKVLFLSVPNTNSFEIMFYRGTFEVSIVLLLMLFTGFFDMRGLNRSLLRRESPWITSLFFFGCLSNYLVVSSLEYLPVTIAALLNNTFPLFVIVVAYMLLREALSTRQIVVIITALCGVMAMSINSIYKEGPLQVSGKTYFIGIMLIVASEVLGSVSYVAVKQISSLSLVQICSFKIIVIYAVAVVYMMVQAIKDYSEFSKRFFQLNLVVVILYVSMGSLNLLTNFLIMKSFQLEKGGLSASMNFLCVVWALIVDMFFFNASFSCFEFALGLFILLTTSAIVFI